jgi:glycosyltransferase 2 family protein
LKKEQVKNYFKFLIKLLLTGVALYFVFKKIDVPKFISTLRGVNPGYFFLAILSFNISKLISAYRLKNFYKEVGLNLTNPFNLRLYFVGMFYNLFLPGSIGGDGYKVYILNQHSEIKLKPIVAATFLDRVSGMVFLVMIALFLSLFSSFEFPFPYHELILGLTIAAVIPVYWVISKWLFPQFRNVFWVTSIQALGVQIGQICTATFLLLSLSVQDHYFDYLTLFMIASAVAVLPLTIGGVGLREAVFLLSLKFLPIDEATSIAFTLSYFIVTAITSLFGLLFIMKIDKRAEQHFSI